MNPNKREVISISFPAWLARELRNEAEKHSMNVSAYLKEIFIEHLTKEAMTGGNEHGS